MTNYKNAMNDFQEHATKDYHLLVGYRVTDFLNSYNSGGKKYVNVFFDDCLNQVIEYNHKRLMPIIKLILFCTQINLPLREYRESVTLKCADVRKEC
jgi:hypothetical protein